MSILFSDPTTGGAHLPAEQASVNLIADLRTRDRGLGEAAESAHAAVFDLYLNEYGHTPEWSGDQAYRFLRRAYDAAVDGKIGGTFVFELRRYVEGLATPEVEAAASSLRAELEAEINAVSLEARVNNGRFEIKFPVRLGNESVDATLSAKVTGPFIVDPMVRIDGVKGDYLITDGALQDLLKRAGYSFDPAESSAIKIYNRSFRPKDPAKDPIITLDSGTFRPLENASVGYWITYHQGRVKLEQS